MSKTGFVIVCRPRCGSTFLQQMLNSHPQVRCDGELLTPASGLVPYWLLRLVRPYPFLYFGWKRWCCRRPVYGFKQMMFSLTTRLSPGLLARHFSFFGWRVISLRRGDVLAQAFSHALASHTGKWHRDDSADRDITTNLPWTVIERSLNYILRDRQREEALLAGVDHLELWYENDLESPETHRRTQARIMGYLGIEAREMKSELVRTYDRPWWDIIKNSDELISRLEASDFSYLLATSRLPGHDPLVVDFNEA